MLLISMLLNVFPVPDGDTGTNMLLTMRSCIEEAYRAPDNAVLLLWLRPWQRGFDGGQGK